MAGMESGCVPRLRSTVWQTATRPRVARESRDRAPGTRNPEPVRHPEPRFPIVRRSAGLRSPECSQVAAPSLETGTPHHPCSPARWEPRPQGGEVAGCWAPCAGAVTTVSRASPTGPLKRSGLVISPPNNTCPGNLLRTDAAQEGDQGSRRLTSPSDSYSGGSRSGAGTSVCSSPPQQCCLWPQRVSGGS